ncbi:MAG: hypothetical protein AAFU70_08465, partial [Planctomycetota bacterium]
DVIDQALGEGDVGVGRHARRLEALVGMTTNPDIPFAKSLVDYIFRWLGIQFIPGYAERVVPQRSGESKTAEPANLSGESRWERTSEAGPPAPRSRGTDTGTPTPTGPGLTRSDRQSGGGAATTRAPEAGDRPAAGTAPGGSQASPSASSTLSEALDSAGDAPPCDVCGTITVRSGTCYKCLNCGNSMGCS